MEFQEPEAGYKMASDFARGPDFWGWVELEKQPWAVVSVKSGLVRGVALETEFLRL